MTEPFINPVYEIYDGDGYYKFIVHESDEGIIRIAYEEDANKERGGKPVADNLLKPVKRDGKRGKVLEWFMDTGEARSVREAMAEFEASRSSVLSYLHNLNKDHGIGYVLVGDTALVSMPADVGDKGPWL